MHYTKCSLEIACRLSVRLSVTLVDHDHIGWKSWKLIARTISPISSLFVSQRSSIYSQSNMEKFWGENVRSSPTSITSGWIESAKSHVILSGGVAVCLLLLAHRAVIFAIPLLSYFCKRHLTTRLRYTVADRSSSWWSWSVLCDAMSSSTSPLIDTRRSFAEARSNIRRPFTTSPACSDNRSPQGAFISRISSHLISTDLISSELSGSGCAVNDQTRQRDLLRSDWSQPRRTASFHSALTATWFRWN